MRAGRDARGARYPPSPRRGTAALLSCRGGAGVGCPALVSVAVSPLGWDSRESERRREQPWANLKAASGCQGPLGGADQLISQKRLRIRVPKQLGQLFAFCGAGSSWTVRILRSALVCSSEGFSAREARLRFLGGPKPQG